MPSTDDTRRIIDLLELAKLNGTEYMLVDDGSQSLKISVDTLLGYMTADITGKIAANVSVPFGTIFLSTEPNAQSDFEKRFGGDWESIGYTIVTTSNESGKTLYLYKKISQDSGVVATGSGGSGSGIVVIPEGEDLPAVSRTAGMFYINVDTVTNAHYGNGLSGNIRVGSNMGLKVVSK